VEAIELLEKLHRRELRILRTRLGRLIRDIGRKIASNTSIEAAFALPLARANQIRGQFVLHARALPGNPGALTRKAIEMAKDGDCLARRLGVKLQFVRNVKEWQVAMESLLLVAEHNGPTMFARIGVMRALNRHVERVFNPDRKDPHWGKRKLARDR
jgi:hypothetical protein